MPGRKRAPYAHCDDPCCRIILAMPQWFVCPDIRSGADYYTHRGGVYVRDAQGAGVCGVARWPQATPVDPRGSDTDTLARADGALGAPPQRRGRATLDRAAECGPHLYD